MLIVLFVVSVAWAETAKEWSAKGVSAMEIGYYNVAIKCFEKAITMDPNDSESHFNIGLSYSKEGKTQKAISYYKKAISLGPDFAKAHYHLGAIYAEERKLKKAISEFKKAIAIKPDYREAHQSLGVAYDERGILDEAISEYKKTLTMNPNIPIINYNLGVVYYKKDLNALAADYLYKAGLLYLKQSKRDGALKAYEKLKQTTSKGLDRALFEKLYPELKNKKDKSLE